VRVRRVPRALAVARRRLTGYALVAPAVVLVLGLLAYAVLGDVWLSLTDDTGGAGPVFPSLRHYRRLVADPVFWEAARNTLVLVVGTGIVELVVAALTALLIWWRFWGRTLVFVSVFVPWAFPATFSAFAWYWLLLPPFSAFYGQHIQAWRWWLEGLLGGGAWQVLAIAIMNVWRGSSICAVFLLAGLNAIPDELLDVGRLEAPSRWRYFRDVVLPLWRRLLGFAVPVTLAVTYGEYASMYVETGGRVVVPVLGTLAFRETVQNGNVGLGAATALMPVPVAVAAALVCLRWVEGARPPTAARPAQEGTGRHRAVPGPSVGASHWPARGRSVVLLAGGAGAAIGAAAFHLLPLYYTTVQALRPVTEYARANPLWVYAPTLEEVRAVLLDPVIWQWGWNTVVVFGGVLLVGLAVSLAAAYSLARFEPPGSRWLLRLMFCSYFVSPMAVVVPLLRLYQQWGLDDSRAGLGLLYLTLTVPFATWLLYAYFRGLPAEVEEHARLDAGHLRIFFRVVVPMSWPIVIAAGLFGLGLMASDVLYGSMLSLSPGTKTLPAALGLTAVELDEWASANAAILLAALPIIVACAALSPSYVRGLRAALIEGA
jgi:multiple sugar transport system permease protein